MTSGHGETPKPSTCPNARCRPGAILLGFKAPNGRIMNLRTAMAVDTDFVTTARQIGPPERRMRFAAQCEGDSCKQWADGRCGVIDRFFDKLDDAVDPIAETLPSCPIRATCQWYRQCGASACAACELFITDRREITTGEHQRRLN